MRDGKRLTPRQQEVLDVIVQEIETNGFPPTVREIRDLIGVNSIRGASVHLDALEKKGFIRRLTKARGIQVLRRGDGILDSGEIRIPLIGHIQAGGPIWAEENFERYINVKTNLLHGYRNAYALRVQGDSMLDAGIDPGDIALIFPTETAQSGEIVVALIEGSVTLKRFHKVDAYIALLPANPKYQPIIGVEFNIQGRMIGLIKPDQSPYGSLMSDATLVPITNHSASDEPKPKNHMVQWVYGSTHS